MLSLVTLYEHYLQRLGIFLSVRCYVFSYIVIIIASNSQVLLFRAKQYIFSRIMSKCYSLGTLSDSTKRGEERSHSSIHGWGHNKTSSNGKCRLWKSHLLISTNKCVSYHLRFLNQWHLILLAYPTKVTWTRNNQLNHASLFSLAGGRPVVFISCLTSGFCLTNSLSCLT